jgi:hypothetical protein
MGAAGLLNFQTMPLVHGPWYVLRQINGLLGVLFQDFVNIMTRQKSRPSSRRWTSPWTIPGRSSFGVTVHVGHQGYIVFFKIPMIYPKIKAMDYGWRYKGYFVEELESFWCNTLLHTAQAGEKMIQLMHGQQIGMTEQIEKQGEPIFFVDKLFWSAEHN